MKLNDYFEERGIPVTEFARRCDISAYRIYHCLRGCQPTLLTALIIEKATAGSVKPLDLLPQKLQYKINGKEEGSE